jgi:hypothetical protein
MSRPKSALWTSHSVKGHSRNKVTMALSMGLTKLVRQSYVLSKAYHQLRLHRLCRRKGEPIIIFQMGRVGSTTIMMSLAQLKPRRPIFHVHFLSAQALDKTSETLKRFCGKHYDANAWCLLESEFLRRRLLEKWSTRRCKVISFAREPISRNISSFFYNVEKYIPNYYKACSITTEELTHIYLEQFIEHDLPLNWFDQEMKPYFGMNVYACEFPTKAGYKIYVGKSADLLVMRVEDLNKCSGAAFKEFLGIKDFALRTENASAELRYSEGYRDFMREIKLPESYIERMYRSKYMRHFYEKEEIDGFRAKWLRR